MLCVVSGRRRYLRKIFNGKTFTVSKIRENRENSPSNDLTYTVCCTEAVPVIDKSSTVARVTTGSTSAHYYGSSKGVCYLG